MPEILTPHEASGTQTAAGRYSGFESQYIDGQWRRGRGQKTIRDLNPYTGETLLETRSANKDDLDDAYRAAK